MTEIHSGGCQCGALRFRVEGPLGEASICHCRMCQKAFGGFYAPLVSVPETSRLVWTRGSLKHFQSSNHANRGFCADCGTPLTYEAPDGIALAIGTFDDPSQIPPSIQFGVEAKLPYADSMAQIPERVTEDDMEAAPFLASLVSFQHPDHDTETWPPVRTGANDNE
ncbi:aldehyde-activating protein [Roseibium algicola]|uniref:Aldehyde-activating protein n=1 Tax=Roseibium algicola TaxID=2857014 RepID=A0ABM6HW98_9HYPH|nr:GFA family protein [Roseibium aggregatum]AQQ02321.1 aldehyde-activating protein [Roseibium aggregatum]